MAQPQSEYLWLCRRRQEAHDVRMPILCTLLFNSSSFFFEKKYVLVDTDRSLGTKSLALSAVGIRERPRESERRMWSVLMQLKSTAWLSTRTASISSPLDQQTRYQSC